MALETDTFHIRCVHFEEKVTVCDCVFILNHSIIKNCALTPSTGHYNSDTPCNF